MCRINIPATVTSVCWRQTVFDRWKTWGWIKKLCCKRISFISRRSSYLNHVGDNKSSTLITRQWSFGMWPHIMFCRHQVCIRDTSNVNNHKASGLSSWHCLICFYCGLGCVAAFGNRHCFLNTNYLLNKYHWVKSFHITVHSFFHWFWWKWTIFYRGKQLILLILYLLFIQFPDGQMALLVYLPNVAGNSPIRWFCLEGAVCSAGKGALNCRQEANFRPRKTGVVVGSVS